MKKFWLFVVILLVVLPSFAHAQTTTTHYSLTQPAIGNTTTWGVSTNANWSTVDSALWAASGGLTVSVNSQTTSSSITLTNPLDSYQNISFTASGQDLILPAMNVTSSMVVGGTLYINNAGSNAFGVLAQDGTTSIVSSLAAGQSIALTLTSAATANGTFNTLNFIPTTGAFVFPGNVSIGTSSTGTYALSVVQAGTHQEYVGSTGTNASTVTIDDAAGSQASQVIFGDAGSAKWTLGKNTDNTFQLADNVGNVPFIKATTGGAIALGAAQNFSIDVNGNATTLTQAAGDNSTNIATTAFVFGTFRKIVPHFITTTGTYTPCTGLVQALVEEVGGGGGGGGNNGGITAGGGGAGEYAYGTFNAVDIGTSQPITIGTSGAGGTTAPTAGSTGGTTSFGTLMTALGGSGGTILNTSGDGRQGGLGGTGGTGCDYHAPGYAGSAGGIATGYVIGGTGGNSKFGAGGVGAVLNGSPSNAVGFGSGGGGGAETVAHPGGNGGTGAVYILDLCSQ